MKLIQLHYFLEVCRQGSIAKATKTLHITQPSISAAIKELESEFGVDLFLRANKKLTLTAEGEILRDHAAVLLRESDELVRKMKELGSKRSTIRLGIPPDVGFTFFPRIFSGFKEEHPDISIEISEHGTGEILRLLEEGGLDIAIAVGNDIGRGSVEMQTIKRSQICFYTNRANLLATRRSLTLDKLGAVPLIMYNEGTYIGQALHAAFRKAGTAPEIILETNQNATIYNFVHSNIASAFVLEGLHIASEATCTIPLSPALWVEISLIWNRHSHLHPNTNRFIQFMRRQSL